MNVGLCLSVDVSLLCIPNGWTDFYDILCVCLSGSRGMI